MVGVPRSGTTLLRLMLDAHSQLAIPPETQFLEPLLATDNAESFVKTITTVPRWPHFQLDPDELGRRVRALPTFTIAGGLRTFYRLYAERFGKQRWGDKTPIYLVRMSQIQTLLPEAHFVHLIRDGRDVALSLAPRSWGPNSIPEVASMWAHRIRCAREEAPRLHGYLEVRYEDLTSDPEGSLRRICDFLRLPWESTMLDYHQHAEERLAEQEGDLRTQQVFMPAAERRWVHRLTSRPPLPGHSHWRERLSSEDLEAFDTIASDVLEELGYPRTRTSSSQAG